MLRAWQDYKASDFRQPPGIETGTLLEAGSEEPRCWWASLETVIANDYNLAAGRYKPQVAETVSDDDPTVLIAEVLEIERKIAFGLERLLQEIS